MLHATATRNPGGLGGDGAVPTRACLPTGATVELVAEALDFGPGIAQLLLGPASRFGRFAKGLSFLLPRRFRIAPGRVGLLRSEEAVAVRSFGVEDLPVGHQEKA